MTTAEIQEANGTNLERIHAEIHQMPVLRSYPDVLPKHKEVDKNHAT